MGIYIEAIILYILLFFSGVATQIISTAPSGDFSPGAEIARIILFIIPSIALIWYLTLRTWKPECQVIRPGRKDLISFAFSFPCLLITGTAIAFISSNITNSAIEINLHTPSNVTEWIIICLTCLSGAYLEESFFRFYLFSKGRKLGISSVSILTLSTALFSICHIYEGPWGFLNAVLCGAFLGFMFLRYNSLHGIALAHGLYNIAAFVINTLTS